MSLNAAVMKQHDISHVNIFQNLDQETQSSQQNCSLPLIKPHSTRRSQCK